MAELQHGCIHRKQLAAAGIGRSSVATARAQGRLHQIRRSVFLVGSEKVEPMAALAGAVLQLEGDAVVSHRSAGVLWELTDQHPPYPEITVAERDPYTRRAQLIVHRSRSLDAKDVRWRRDLPVTSPARTVVDLAGVLDSWELESAVAIALRRRLASVRQIEEAIERAPITKKGVARLRDILADPEGAAETRSLYERRLLALIAEAELPRPLTNVTVEGHLVDMYWPAAKLVVEFDSWAWHRDRRNFEEDRLRDQRLVAAGHRVLRITARQVNERAFAVVARLAAGLAHTPG